MASRQSFVVRLYLVGLAAVVLLGVLVALLLHHAVTEGDLAARSSRAR